jgi:GST-like protein
MITLYAHGSPNPHKVSIALEELGLSYQTRIVDIWNGEQQLPDFLELNPNGKVPIIVDSDTGQTIFESNAILLYLAEKEGRLFPTSGPERIEGLQLLFLQAASVGPMWGQRAHFSLFAPDKLPYPIERYEAEGRRIEAVLDALLGERDHFLASGYSIVDITMFGWAWCAHHQGFPFDAHPRLQAWFDRVAARPAVAKGVVTPLPLPDFSGLRQPSG